MYVYLLRSESKPEKTYIGATEDLAQRLEAHNGGRSPHTSKFGPWSLQVSIWFDDPDKAWAFESYLKRGSPIAPPTRQPVIRSSSAMFSAEPIHITLC